METNLSEKDRDYGEDVTRLAVGDKEILLIGTAHISRESADLVRRVIEAERPDCVCVELDSRRFKALTGGKPWQNMNLRELIRQGQLLTLFVHLTLSSYQKRLGGALGVMPGTEFVEAARIAESHGIPMVLCDRDVGVTLKRAWRMTPFYKKAYLLAAMLAGLFENTEITPETIEELKKRDVLSEMMNELGTLMPSIKTVLIDERDTYLSETMKAAAGRRIVAVVGAGHLAGIEKAVPEDRGPQMDAIGMVPPASPVWKVLGWGVPAAIVAVIAAIAWKKGGDVAAESILFWTLANGIPTAVGGILALAHPATILAGFAAAPLTSLTPLIGAAHVTAFTQAFFQPPVVRDFEAAAGDMATFPGWWKNRLLKVFLAFFLPGIGSMIGTWIGGYGVFSSLF